jgi:tRNA pseudouridine13 synthase
MHASIRELPYATAKSLRILGKIRGEPEDFRVDEVPAYEPTGQGTHLFVRFEKRGLTTREAVDRIARALGTSPRDAGFAGLKDRHAVTTQWASFMGPQPQAALDLCLPDLRVLEAVPHPHKLRTGHLRKNKFQIRIRGEDLDVDVARTVAAELARMGAPNYYGEQRFGRDDRNLTRARAWVLGSGHAPRDRFERKLLFSTLQSSLFNAWLAQRLHDGLYELPVPGDLLRKEDTGGLFLNEDQAEATRRMQAWEVSPTGPMFGASMRWAEGQAGQQEHDVLARTEIAFDTLAQYAKYGEGTRRVSRVRPEAWAIEAEAGALLASFELPSGAYATMVLRELLKPDASAPESDLP